MRWFFPFVLAAASFTPTLTKGQGQVASPSMPKTGTIRAEDGGVSETMESIIVSAKPNAPFTLTLETEWVQKLADGGTVTLVNKRRISRDAAGRVSQERWWLVPKNGKTESQKNALQISDPDAHTLYNCFFLTKPQVCQLLTYVPMEPAVQIDAKPGVKEMPNDQGSVVHEDLGRQLVSGIETVGVRDTTIYNPGVVGNDQRMTVEREQWYSPQLDINLLSVRSDPLRGKQTFTARDVILGDPDPALFELPAGFKVVDRRQNAPPEPN